VNFDKQEVFTPGEVFHGYRVERLLGNGALGAVYLVRHELLDTLFALKVLFPDVPKSDPTYVTRFLREARIATRIRHRNLVAVHACGLDEPRGLYYLVMDYVSGGDLRQAIAFAGRFDPARAAQVIVQLASALDAAQRFRVVHRDIKPENIMVQPDGLVKLVDLGIAKADDVKDSLNTAVDTLFGTPAYMAPEQAIDPGHVDTRADIYSLGVVFFEMVSGRLPFNGATGPQILSQTLSSDPFPDVRDFNPKVDPLLAALIRRMCVKERERRIASPAQLLGELAKLGYRPETRTDEIVHYAASADSLPTQRRSMKAVLEGLPAEVNDTLSFETEDVEIRDFVATLKRRRFVRRVMLILAGLVVAAVVSAGLILLFIADGR